MKTNFLLKIRLGLVVLSFVFSSCGRTINGIQLVRWNKNSNSSSEKNVITFTKTHKGIIEEKLAIDTLTSNVATPISIKNENTVTASTEFCPVIVKKSYFDGCDVIVLKSGEEINAKVTEIGTSEIKYKKCDNPDGPLYTVSKSEVFMIKYSNGTKDIINSANGSTQNNSNNNPPPQNNYTQPKSNESNGSEVWGIVAFICGLVGLLVFPIPFGVVALIFGAVGVNKKLKGLAIAGVILGFIDIVVGLIILLAYAYY